MSNRMVALFQGDAADGGLRLLARTRDPALVRQVRRWFLTRSRTDAERVLRNQDDSAGTPTVQEPEGGGQ